MCAWGALTTRGRCLVAGIVLVTTLLGWSAARVVMDVTAGVPATPLAVKLERPSPPAMSTASPSASAADVAQRGVARAANVRDAIWAGETGGRNGHAPLLIARDEFMAAIAETPWPEHLREQVWHIATCESAGVGADVVYTSAVGDSGRAWGVMQVRVDQHPDLLRTFNLFDLRESLTAAYVLYLQAGGFAPWTCSEVQS